MKEALHLLPEYDGKVVHHSFTGYVHFLHHHDELEVNIVERGSATYLLGDRRYDLRRHSQIWLFPKQDHVLVNQSADYEMWYAVFKPRMLRRACTTEPARVLLEGNPAGSFCKRLSEDCAAHLIAIFEELGDAMDDVAFYNATLRYLLLAAWRAHLQADQQPPPADLHPAVEKATYLIRDHPEMNHVEELAREVGLSGSRLSRLFRQQTGVSLVDYRNQQRIERFRKVYGMGRDRTMLDAALEAGFGSYAQFHRIFREIVGCSPAQYRRNLGED